jgi:hypothetical protein
MAQPQRRGSGPNGDAPHCPPPAAFSACSGASDGDACTFNGRGDDVVSGACHVFRDGGALCVPDGAPTPPDDAAD